MGIAIADAIDAATPGDFTDYAPLHYDDGDEFSPDPYTAPAPETGPANDW